MAKQYIAVTVIKNGTKHLNPGDVMPEKFVPAKTRDGLVESGALRIEEAETENPSKQPPEDNSDDSPAGEDSEGTDDSK